MMLSSVRSVGATSLRRTKLPASSFARAWQSTTAASTTLDTEPVSPSGGPQLVEVPSLPFFGSLISSYSKTPPFDDSKTYELWPELRRRFGDFYSIGLPGVGEDLYGTMYVIQDPKEMMKILRREGSYPTSIVQKQWAVKTYFENSNFGRVAAILEHGPEWKRIRSFLQTDLLSPQSAARYMPGIIRAAEFASKGAAYHEGDFKLFLNDASFDMFSTILLGDFPRITDPTTESDPDNIRFSRAVANALYLNGKLNRDIKSTMMYKYLGFKTALYKEFEENWAVATEIALRKIEEVLMKRESNTLSQDEIDSYLNQAMDRQVADSDKEDAVTPEEVKYIALSLLSASVDTTSGMMAGNLMHISQNLETQERIYSELMEATGGTGKLTPEAVSLTSVPFLHAAIRESHRITSPSPLSTFRIIPDDFEVHGLALPANSTVAFDGYSQGMDPDLVEDVEEFRPERWLPEAVEARKGTPAAVLDHPLFAGPFSQGARRCPGSRVARNEILILLSQLILDYKMTCSVESWKDVPIGQDTVIVPRLPKIDFEAR